MGDFVELYEVGPRDGLQNETAAASVAQKVALVDLLSRSGLRRIECASFVSPRWVPQMASSGDVLRAITRAAHLRYAALTPNLRGLQDAVAAGVDEVAVFAAASEGFSRANTNASIADSLERLAPVVTAAKAAGLFVRGYVSCVVACPFDGAVAPAQVARLVERLRAMGCDDISLGDTIGVGVPDSVQAMIAAVCDVAPPAVLAGHFHDTNGRALDNIDAALAAGLRMFDTAAGGLGGCPYAPGASGNVATERVARHLGAAGYDTGLDLAVIDQAAAMARGLRGQGHV